MGYIEYIGSFLSYALDSFLSSLSNSLFSSTGFKFLDEAIRRFDIRENYGIIRMIKI